VTVLFGVFVLLTALWLMRYMRKSNPLELTHEELSDDQKALIYKFCNEMREARELTEKVQKHKAEENIASTRRKSKVSKK
jgi:hypothetical protein